jgi:PAS domain-containing protein
MNGNLLTPSRAWSPGTQQLAVSDACAATLSSSGAVPFPRITMNPPVGNFEQESQLGVLAGELNDLKIALDQHAIVATINAEGKFSYVNDRFCAISKYTREELLGKDYWFLDAEQQDHGWLGVWANLG